MTDKELRKLSRLELLELLLEVSKENSKLKEQIDRLNDENKTNQNIENLSVMTRHMENSLRYAKSLADSLKMTSDKAVTSDNIVKTDRVGEVRTNDKSEQLSDVEIYKRMLCFFANNDDKLSVFPTDVENSVRARIRSILERRKQN